MSPAGSRQPAFDRAARRPVIGRAARAGLLISLIAAASACGGHHSTATEVDGGTEAEFIAVQGDFANYRSWTVFDGGTQAFDGIPIVEQRTMFLNRLPEHESKAFPNGTIIVKETGSSSNIFAMAKRGGNFNSAGTPGWEWFEIANGVTGTTIVWRGVVPPVGQTYGNTIASSCNGCHGTTFESNDYVGGTAISLSQF